MGTCQSRSDDSDQLVVDLESGESFVVMRSLTHIQELVGESGSAPCKLNHKRILRGIDTIVSEGPIDDKDLRTELANTITLYIEYYISKNDLIGANTCISTLARFAEENPSVRYSVLDSLMSVESNLSIIGANEDMIVCITNGLSEANRQPDNKKPGGFRDIIRILSTFIRISEKATEYALKRNVLSTLVDSLDFVRNPFTCDSLIELVSALCIHKPELVVSDPQFVAILNKVFFSESIGLSSRALSATISLLHSLVELDNTAIDAILIHSNFALSITTLMIQSAPGMVSSESSLAIIETLLERAHRRVNQSDLCIAMPAGMTESNLAMLENLLEQANRRLKESDLYKVFISAPKKSLIAELKRLVEDSGSSPQEKHKAHGLLRLVSSN